MIASRTLLTAVGSYFQASLRSFGQRSFQLSEHYGTLGEAFFTLHNDYEMYRPP